MMVDREEETQNETQTNETTDKQDHQWGTLKKSLNKIILNRNLCIEF